VRLGIDVFTSNKLRRLKGARVGLCVNLASCDSALIPTFSLFLQQKKFRLTAVFAPEHGLFSALQDQVLADHFYDKKRGINIYSLYSDRLVSEEEINGKIDLLVIDLQDIGARYYTFLWSAVLLIEQMARLNKKIFVLDRPNPLNGVTVQGPVLESGFLSFVGLYMLPVRHGMTIGELCRMINDELRLDADLEIIKMKGWKRRAYFTDYGLYWTPPSPNMPSFQTALVYPGMCLLEGTNISEGRGTTRPFEIFGAPWIEPFFFVKKLQSKKITGAKFRPVTFIPTFNKYAGKPCGGAQIYVTDRKRFNPVTAGLEIIKTIRILYPTKFRWRRPPYEFEKKKPPFDILIGNEWIRKALEKNNSIAAIQKVWQSGLSRFKRQRRKYLLYD